MRKSGRFGLALGFCHDRRFRICLFWCVGLFLGTFFAAVSDASFLSLMRQAAESRVSIVSLLTAVLLPFLFSALAVYMGRPRALYAICLLKAICFSYSMVLTVRSFGSAGWLIQPMLQFSDILLCPLLLWFQLRHIRGGEDVLKKDLRICAAVIVAVTVADAILVSPFLAELISS